MFQFHPISYADKRRFYRELQTELEGLLEKTWFTNLANASALLMAHLPDLNWAGFYMVNGSELVLGPFQGLPACLRIAISEGKGVCGTASARKQTMLVDDVHLFPGHIACDARSRSEIVIPMVNSERLLGVLDLDAPIVKRFDEVDQRALEQIVQVLVEGTIWPESFL
jgi:GAF domain-containing protein